MKTKVEPNTINEEYEVLNKKLAGLSEEELGRVTGGGTEGYKYSFRSNDWVYSDPMQSYIIVIDEDVDTDEDTALVKGHRMKNGDAWNIVFKLETFHAMALYSDFVRNGGKLAAMS